MNSLDIVVLDYESTSGAGVGMNALRQSIQTQASGLSVNDLPESNLPTWVGKVHELDHHTWKSDELKWASRNNALINLCLKQGTLTASVNRLKSQLSSERIGIVMGSSTSSIDRSETAYRELTEEGQLKPQYLQENVFNPHAPGLYVADYFGISGPSLTINTACSSSAKVFATAARWLRLGLVDAVIVGGADTLCLSVLHGFHSLQLVSENPCKPFDGSRDGINLGEAAGFAVLMRKEDATTQHCGIQLCGFGESSDAHHMSHPHPDGLGAKLAIEQALNIAHLKPEAIDYINLHGTASKANDHIEGNIIASMFSDHTITSSTKGWMGHTLGAAGIMEAIISFEALLTGLLPGTLNLERVDSEIPLNMSNENQERDTHYAMSNSFGFGGNNCSLIFGRV